MPVAPSRSLDQRRSALKKANDVRTLRADAKRDLSFVRAAELVTEPPWWADTWKARELLMALPKIGRTKSGEILRACKISDAKTIGGLSDRQRSVLAYAIRLRGRSKPQEGTGGDEPPVDRPQAASVAEKPSEHPALVGRDAR